MRILFRHRRPRHRRHLSSSWLAAWGCLALAGCGPGESAELPGPVEIVISGDTAGWIVPCGCTSNQSGGLPRRASYLSAAKRSAAVATIDVGGAASGASRYDVERFAAILRGERLMGVAAHNVGASEAALGAETLRRLAEETGVPLLSANVRDDAGEGVGEPWKVVAAGGRRVLLVGVLAQRFAAAGLVVCEPYDAVLSALAAARGKYDAAIVLAYLPDGELEQLAARLPEIDAVVGGPTGQSMATTSPGAPVLASATNKGKFLISLRSPEAASARWTATIVEMNPQWKDDGDQMANIKSFRSHLAELDLPASDTSFVRQEAAGHAEYGAAGTRRCIECHQEDGRAWENSGHAEAWQTLVDAGAEMDASCQRCHTTEFGLAGGFVSAKRSADRVNVGCESCHGPSTAHSLRPQTRTAYFAAARDRCVDCHDHENSPAFALDAYWPRIRHGARLDATRSSSTREISP